jgi:hypothetical protein
MSGDVWPTATDMIAASEAGAFTTSGPRSRFVAVNPLWWAIQLSPDGDVELFGHGTTPQQVRVVPKGVHAFALWINGAYLARIRSGYLVSWMDETGHLGYGFREATETFRDPLAAIERAIALQEEIQ